MGSTRLALQSHRTQDNQIFSTALRTALRTLLESQGLKESLARVGSIQVLIVETVWTYYPPRKDRGGLGYIRILRSQR